MAEFTIYPESENNVNINIFDENNVRIYSKKVTNNAQFARSLNIPNIAQSNPNNIVNSNINVNSPNNEYRFCFLNEDTNIAKNIFLSIQFTPSSEIQSLAKKSQLSPIENQLKEIEKETKKVHSEMQYLQTREIKMREINDSTHRRMNGFAIFSMLFLVILTGLQVMYLKKYFRKKKIID
jgi:hypothetical protein